MKTSRTALALACTLAFTVISACSNSQDETADSEAAAEEAPPAPESFIDRLKAGRTAEDWLAVLEDTFVRQRLKQERWTRAFQISIARAQLAYAQAVNEKFGGIDGSPMPTDLGMTELARAMDDAQLRNVKPRQAEVHYQLDGEDRVMHIVLEQGRWRMDVRTYNDGQLLRVAAYQQREPRYKALHHYTELVTGEIEDGTLTSAAEARAKLDELMSDPSRFPAGPGDPRGLPDDDVRPRG